jgi:Tol biopolymer transport system component
MSPNWMKKGLPGPLLVAAVTALATAATADSELVFVGSRQGIWSLYRDQGVGGPPQALRPDLVFDASAPALSPDGSYVAFEVPGQGILVCPLEGEAPCETLKTDLGWPVRPTWNPATGEIVFVRYVADASGEDSDILVASPDLSGIRPLVSQTGNQDFPAVSPDGRFLVYDSAQTVSLHRGGVQVVRHLWVMDLESGAARPLVPGVGQDMQADISPEGRRIAFASDRGGDDFEIWVVGLDGEGLRQVTSGEGSKTWPAWSPDGETLLYTRAHEGGTELWKIAVDGSANERYEPFGAGSDMQLRDPDWR